MLTIMEITKKTENGELVLAVSGCLDTAATAAFTEAAEAAAQESKTLVFDFAGLEFIASSALRLLVSLEKRLKASGGGITLANLNEVVRDVFEVTGLSEIFPIR